MTRGTNLMQKLWFIIINNSTCFGHLYVHLQECRLCTAACGVQHCALQCWTHAAVHNLHSWRCTYRCPKHVELFMIINHNCCIKLVPLVIFPDTTQSYMRAHVLIFFMWRYSSTHSQRGTRRRGGVNCTPRPHYPRGKNQSPPGSFGEEKNFLLLPGFKPRTLHRPRYSG